MQWIIFSDWKIKEIRDVGELFGRLFAAKGLSWLNYFINVFRWGQQKLGGVHKLRLQEEVGR